MIGTITRNDFALGATGGEAGDLDCVLVGVGAAESEKHPAAHKPRAFEQTFGQFGPTLCAPGVTDKAQAFGLFADGRDQAGMLVTQVAALGQAAHIENLPSIGQVEISALTADHGRGIPVGLDAPAVQHGLALGAH